MQRDSYIAILNDSSNFRVLHGPMKIKKTFTMPKKPSREALQNEIERLTASASQYPFKQFIRGENVQAAVKELCKMYEQSDENKNRFVERYFYPCIRMMSINNFSAADFKADCWFAVNMFYRSAGKAPPQGFSDAIEAVAQEMQRTSLFMW